MATKAPLSEKELEEFRVRLQEERVGLETQLTTIEESSFAAIKQAIIHNACWGGDPRF